MYKSNKDNDETYIYSLRLVIEIYERSFLLI